MKHLLLLTALAIFLYTHTGAQSFDPTIPRQATIKIFNGTLTDSKSDKKIPYATVWMRGTNISVISNGDGDFSLKIPEGYPTDSIYIKHIGYSTKSIAMEPNPGDRLTIPLDEANIAIDKITVGPNEPLNILQSAIHNIRKNYPTEPQKLVGFYREMIKKNNRYVSVVEAIPDIYKAPTTSMFGDQVRLYKGRRSYDVSRIDTLLMKYQGGLSTAMILDIAKRYDILFTHIDSIEYNYTLRINDPVEIQGRPQYVLSFDQIERKHNPMLYRGNIYIDMESRAISRCEYYMNVERHTDAYRAFIVSLPARYRVKMLKAKFTIDYKYDSGLWHYNYSGAEIAMKVRSDKRRFNADYTIISELVVTDRSNADVEKFPSKERLKTNDMVFDKIIDYDDDMFWEGYNAIEPEQTIENAVRRLNRRIDTKNIR